MEVDGYKKFTKQAKSGIKGEALFELLMTDYALPHRVIGSKDIGIDYFCEWVYGDKPSGILFIAQVKTFADKNIKFTHIPREPLEKPHNQLEEYEISHDSLRIGIETINYWKGLGLPTYLFVMIQRNEGEEINCFYRRYTPQLTAPPHYKESGEYHQGFYKVNKGNTLLAFNDPIKKDDGFARDLFIDHVRCCYAKGLLTYQEPEIMGLNRFEADSIFEDLFEQYKNQICLAYLKIGKYLNHLKKKQTAAHP